MWEFENAETVGPVAVAVAVPWGGCERKQLQRTLGAQTLPVGPMRQPVSDILKCSSGCTCVHGT